MKNHSTKESLGYWISRSARKVDRHFENYLQEFQFTPNEYAILNSIYNDEANKPSELARFLNMDKGYIARQLTRLEQKDYIKRSADTEDKRAQAIELTAKGRRIILSLINGSRETNKRISSILSSQERNTLLEILKKLGNSDF
jgi:DNA-binding MarR family transcriptional regulator